MTSERKESDGALLDRAQTGREVGVLVALTLLQAGDADEALAILRGIELRGVAKPESREELDAVPIAAQAIRDAVGLRSVTDDQRLMCAEHPDRKANAELADTGLGMCPECYRDHRALGAPDDHKPPCLFPLPDGRRCCECDACHWRPEEDRC